MVTIIYECGICDMFHPWAWDGDCRDDANRFFPDEYAIKLGIIEDALDVRSMDERVAMDLSGGEV